MPSYVVDMKLLARFPSDSVCKGSREYLFTYLSALLVSLGFRPGRFEPVSIRSSCFFRSFIIRVYCAARKIESCSNLRVGITVIIHPKRIRMNSHIPRGVRNPDRSLNRRKVPTRQKDHNTSIASAIDHFHATYIVPPPDNMMARVLQLLVGHVTKSLPMIRFCLFLGGGTS